MDQLAYYQESAAARLPAALEDREERPKFQDSLLWKDIIRSSTPKARALLPFSLAQKLSVLPLALVNVDHSAKMLTALFAEPLSAAVVQEVKFITGCEIVGEPFPREFLDRAIYAAYRGEENIVVGFLEQAQGEIPKASASAREPEPESAIPQLLASILDRGISLGASDIHLEPIADKFRLRFRLDGMLREQPLVIPFTTGLHLIRRTKILANLDITEQHRPQEGGFAHGGSSFPVRLRVSILGQANCEKVVFRVLDERFANVLFGQGFAALGMSDEQQHCVQRHIDADRGTVLAVGPTGSGKSTLLYMMLHFLNTSWRNIITLEDPIERRIPGIHQLELDRSRGFEFGDFLPPMLRQDPDVIMIGEIRERKAAEAALTAGMTGQLVLSTLHAGNCLEAFPRLLQLGVQPDILFSSLRLLIGQRLVPLNCPACAAAEKPSERLRRLFYLEDLVTVVHSTGCDECLSTGKKGRVAVFEMMPISEAFREQLFDIATVGVNDRGESKRRNFLSELRKIALQMGYAPYAIQVRQALLQGKISPASALRSIGVSPEIAGYHGV